MQAWLTYREQSHHRELRALLGGPVVFNAPPNRFQFAARELDIPLTGDPHLAKLATARLDEDLAQLSADQRREVLDQVRHRLAARLAGDASLSRIACDLGVSARTLQRQLGTLGTSFQDLLEDVRRTRALAYLTETDDAIENVATRLGYGDPSNFRRAFRRWTGTSPAAFRAERRARLVSDAEP
jgi:AraC-like DNA-binding protein